MGVDEVYRPADDTWLLIASLQGIVDGGLVVEVGCGRGEVSKFLAESGCEVIAIDVSEAAARSAREACASHLGRVHLVVGDKVRVIRPSGRIRLVASNPPYLPSGDDPDPAIDGGPTGAEFSISLIDDAFPLIEQGARIVLVSSTLGNAEAVERYAGARGLRARILSSKKLFFEELRCYEIGPELGRGGEAGEGV